MAYVYFDFYDRMHWGSYYRRPRYMARYRGNRNGYVR